MKVSNALEIEDKTSTTTPNNVNQITENNENDCMNLVQEETLTMCERVTESLPSNTNSSTDSVAHSSITDETPSSIMSLSSKRIKRNAVKKKKVGISKKKKTVKKNRPKSNSTRSAYRGVSYHSQLKKWRCYVYPTPGKQLFVGVYDNELDAAKARDEAMIVMNITRIQLNFDESKDLNTETKTSRLSKSFRRKYLENRETKELTENANLRVPRLHNYISDLSDQDEPCDDNDNDNDNEIVPQKVIRSPQNEMIFNYPYIPNVHSDTRMLPHLPFLPNANNVFIPTVENPLFNFSSSPFLHNNQFELQLQQHMSSMHFASTMRFGNQFAFPISYPYYPIPSLPPTQIHSRNSTYFYVNPSNR